MSKRSARRNAAQGAKRASPVQARYDAAGSGRRLRGWNAPPSGPNASTGQQPKLRDRARDAGRNEWAGASGTRVWTTNLIGVGIIPRPVTKNQALKRRLTDLWNAWCVSADADGVLDFYGLQTLAVRSWIESGEVFIRIRPRRNEDGLAVPLQVQLLESDMVPMINYDALPGMPAGNRIRAGIELDRIGRRVAYWCFRQHPGDRDSAGGVSTADLYRVPADQMRHMFEPLRPGQLRGVSAMAPILAKLRGVMNFDDAVLTRQEIANLITMVITNNTQPQAMIDPVSGQPLMPERDSIEGLEPGTSMATLPGEDVKFVAPPDAGANYAEFMRVQSLGVSAGWGAPYELLTGDIANVSDRTLRVIINEFRRACEQRQWQIVIPMLCTFVRNAWADAAFYGGQLTASEAEDARRVSWNPQGWAYINPIQDVNAQVIAQNNGITSRARNISARGDDPDEIDQERAEDHARAKSMGLIAEEVVTIEQQASASRIAAEARLLDARAARESIEARSTSERLQADASRLRAEAVLLSARAAAADAERELLDAQRTREASESAALLAEREAATAREREESAARISALEEEARAARAEAESTAIAHAAAEAFAATQRDLVLQAERDRAAVAALERQAAELALDELR